MSPATEQLLQAVPSLPAEERLELVEAVLASEGPADELPFDPSWWDEIQRRSAEAEAEAGTVELTSWPVVRERVRQRLENRSGG